MGLISRVSSRTYRKTSKMAKGARNKKRQKARNKRREAIFGPRNEEAQNQIVPDLEKLRKEVKEKNDTEMQSTEMEKFDPKTKRDENGHYPDHMSQREVKKLQKVNKQEKNKKKIKKRRVEKKLKALANNAATRNAFEEAKQQALAAAI